MDVPLLGSQAGGVACGGDVAQGKKVVGETEGETVPLLGWLIGRMQVGAKLGAPSACLHCA